MKFSAFVAQRTQSRNFSTKYCHSLYILC